MERHSLVHFRERERERERGRERERNEGHTSGLNACPMHKLAPVRLKEFYIHTK